MSEMLRELAAELTRVDAAIETAPLYADPADPSSGFSDELVDLIAREEEVRRLLIRDALDEVAGE